MSFYSSGVIGCLMVGLLLCQGLSNSPNERPEDSPVALDEEIGELKAGEGVFARRALEAIAKTLIEGPVTEPERERGREAIYDALKAKDPRIRRRAIHYICEIDGEAATDAILRMVNDSHEAVRQQALHSLGTVGKPSAAAKLENLLVARRNSLKPGERGRDATLIVGTQTLARMRKRGQGISLKEIVDEEWRTSLEAVKNKGTPIPRP